MQIKLVQQVQRSVLVLLMALTACGAAEPEPTRPPVAQVIQVTVFPTPVPTATSAPTPTPTPQPTPTPARPELLLNSMTLEQKVGQIMMIGFNSTTLIPEVREVLTTLHIGGVALFEANVESPLQLAQLVREMQANAQTNGDPALFIAADQEGGPVARLRENLGFTEFPSAMALAATGEVTQARRVAEAMTGEMKAVGINMNLAPVLDVNNNPANPVIGIRSFGSDPLKVGEFGLAMLQVFQSNGILAVGKHFPGHGDTAVDSHISLPLIAYSRNRLNSIELVPFKAAIDNGIAGIMSAHIVFPALDETPNLPSTLSSKVQTTLLRDDLKFDGMAISDALDMGALETAGFTTPEAAARALAAGIDVLTFNTSLSVYAEVHALIVEKVRSGEIPQARLDEAVRRVLRAKERFGLMDAPLVDVETAPSLVGQPATEALSQDVAARAITLVRDNGMNGAKLLPIPAGITNVLVIETPYAIGLAAALDAPVVQVSEQPDSFEIEYAVAAASGKFVVVGTYDVAINQTQADLVDALLAAGVPVVVVAARSPYDALYLQNAPTVVAIYGITQFAAVANALRGSAPMSGTLPVAFQPG